MKYLTPNDKDAFLDFPIRRLKIPHTHKVCHVCRGYGGWNLRVNAYRIKGRYRNTSKNRHLHSHFRCVCTSCHGSGIIPNEESCPGHNYVHLENLGRCYNRLICTVCGKTWDVDSSD